MNKFFHLLFALLFATNLNAQNNYDVNGDGEIDVADVTALINAILKGAGTPAVTTGEAVDLGLSVKWASCNVGATKPEEYGGYYAWGETEEKSNYSWETYKYSKDSSGSLTKYCTSSEYGIVDGKRVLEPEDDVATVKWGGSWRMPTFEEQQELMNLCTWTWTSLNGVGGFNVTGPNGNSIFMPAAGMYYGEDLCYVGGDCICWSSTLGNPPSCVFCLDYGNNYVEYNHLQRYYGHVVRPVCE